MAAKFEGPGAGWVRDDGVTSPKPGVQTVRLWDGRKWCSWTAKPEMLPLPTAPCTVIEATLDTGQRWALTLNDDNTSWYNYRNFYTPADLLSRLTSWRLLAAPGASHYAREAVDRALDAVLIAYSLTGDQAQSVRQVVEGVRKIHGGVA